MPGHCSLATGHEPSREIEQIALGCGIRWSALSDLHGGSSVPPLATNGGMMGSRCTMPWHLYANDVLAFIK